MNVLYYPAEVIRLKKPELLADPELRESWVKTTLENQFTVIRALIRTRRRKDVKALAPKEQRELFEALLNHPAGGHDPAMIDVQLREIIALDLDFDLIRSASRFIRNITVEELIVAGDLGDRGPRLDRVIDYLMHQPNVSLVWGNHDAIWMGACLGQRALIATVLRVSLRYLRMFQIEEGYGLLTKAIEVLALKVYPDDPAARFQAKRKGKRDGGVVAACRRPSPSSSSNSRARPSSATRSGRWTTATSCGKSISRTTRLEVDGKSYPLRDTFLPTIDPADPNKLSDDEEECIHRLEESFTNSPRLWEQMRWMADYGQMALVRDRAVIFHACLPVDDAWRISPAPHRRRGPERPGSLHRLHQGHQTRLPRRCPSASDSDKDWFYYLWAGPLSPLFGKDRMATFETYFIEDKSTHKESRRSVVPLDPRRRFLRQDRPRHGRHARTACSSTATSR